MHLSRLLGPGSLFTRLRDAHVPAVAGDTPVSGSGRGKCPAGQT